MAKSITNLQLKCQKLYSFSKTAVRVRSPYEHLYQEEQGVLYRTMQGEQNPLLLGFVYDAANSCLEVTVYGELAEGEKISLTKKIAHMWSTDKDLSSFYRQFADDPHLSHVLHKRVGLHWVLDASLYECLISTIISQQLNLSFAATLKKRLLRLVGEEIEIRQHKYPVFPRPDQLARLSVEDLRKLQFSQRKAEYVLDLSRQVADGKLDLEKLRNQSNEEIMHKLLPWRGIGKWTIECLLLFGLGRGNLLPAADIGLRNAIQKVYDLQERPSEQEVRQLASSWSPFESYVTFYLWDYIS